MATKTPHILFVCTGNIFRSMSADWASRHIATQKGLDYRFSSAGTDGATPRQIRPQVRDLLLSKGIDITGHQHRLLTPDLIKGADLVVAMSTDHHDFMKDRFGVNSVLFRELAEGKAEALLDVNEAIVDFETNIAAAEAHIKSTIDYVVGRVPMMMERLPLFLK